MNRKSLFDKIEELIEKHIEEIIDKKLSSQKQSLEKFIENEINRSKGKNQKNKKTLKNLQIKEIMFTDVFGVICPISEVNQDHVMPRNENGAGEKSNLMWMCRESNRLKSHETEGDVHGIKFKIIIDNNFNLKSGKSVGTLSIFNKEKKLYLLKSTRNENRKFTKLKNA